MLPSEEELRNRQRRAGWWMLVARLAAGKTQGDAAAAIGLVASSYGDFERAVTPASLRQLAVLASFFGVPLSLFTDPPATDEERLETMTGNRSLRTDAGPGQSPAGKSRRTA